MEAASRRSARYLSWTSSVWIDFLIDLNELFIKYNDLLNHVSLFALDSEHPAIVLLKGRRLHPELHLLGGDLLSGLSGHIN